MKALLSSFTILLSIVVGNTALAAANNLPGCISSHYNDQPITNQSVLIDAPEIAENGSVIGVGIAEVTGIPAGRSVKEVAFYNEFRKEPVASFKLSGSVSAKSLKTRIRLRESSNIYAVARLDNGELLGGQRHIKVTIGGCGGGDASSSVKAPRVCTAK